MAVSVFDLFKIGIGPSQLAHGRPDARGARVRRSACGTTALLARDGARQGRAVRLARRHRQGPRQRQGGAARASRATSPTPSTSTRSPRALQRDPRRRHAARCSASTTIAFDAKNDLIVPPPRVAAVPPQRHALHARSTRPAQICEPRSTTRSAAVSSSTTTAAGGTTASSPDTTPLPLSRSHSGDELLAHVRAARAVDRRADARRTSAHWRDDAEIRAGPAAASGRRCRPASRAAARTEGILPGGLKVQAPRAGAAPPALREPGSRAARSAARCWTGSTCSRWRSTRRTPPAAASSPRRPTARPASSRRCCTTTRASCPAPTTTA